jgi:hypothetical protein
VVGRVQRVHAATPTTPKDPSYYGNARTDVLRVERIDHQELTKPSALLERITRGTSAEFLVFQWALLGRAS